MKCLNIQNQLMKLKLLMLKLLKQILCKHQNKSIIVTKSICTIENIAIKCDNCNIVLETKIEV